MLAGNEAMAARLSAIVWLTMTEARRSEFCLAVKENYRIDAVEGVEALAALFVERDGKTQIDKAHRTFMDQVWHRDVDHVIAHQCRDYSSVDDETFWILVDLTAITFAVTNPKYGESLNRRFIEAVVGARLLLHRGDLLEEIGRYTEIALRGLRRTDAPPATEDAAPANDSQGAIGPDTPILTYRDVQQLVLLLRQAQADALHEASLRGRDKTAEVDAGTGNVDRMDRLDHEQAHAMGRAAALHQAIQTIVDTSPALLGWYTGMRYVEQIIEPHPARTRTEPLPGQRPRKFAWGTPSIMGFIPSLSHDAEAFEVHFTIPEAAGIHPLFLSAGEEVCCRLEGLIQRLVNSTPNANVGVLRLELRDLSAGNDGTWRNGGRFAAAWSGPAPLAGETTAAQLDKIPCPWCGDVQPVPSRADRPSLYAGDVENTQCHSCGGFYQLRFEAAHHLYARPIPK